MNHAQTEWWRAESIGREWQPAESAPAGFWEPPRTAIPFWATMVFISILLFSPQAYFPALESIRPAMIPAVIGIGAYVLDRIGSGAPLFIPRREVWVAGALVAWATVTIPLSIWPGGSLNFLVGYFLKTLAMSWLLSHSAATLVRLRQTTWCLSIMAVGLAMFALHNYLTGVFVEQERVVGNEGALTKNPNDLALMVNIIVPLTMALLLSDRRPMIRLTLFGMLVVEGLTVISTHSRAGFLTLAAILVTYAWKLRRRAERTWVNAILVLALLSLPLLPSSYFDRMSTIIHTEQDATGSAGERWSDMMIAIRYALSSPVVGAGLGMNVLAMNEARGGEWRPVHNVFLELTMDLGVPGMLLFLWLLWTSVSSAAEVQREADETVETKELSYLAEGIHVSLLAFCLAAMFHPVSYHPYFYYLAALALAAQAVLHSMRRACLTQPNPHP
jgi:probable O-glycosylation ligase (exosortase A-associated)